jgi:UDP-N-acetylmuramyl pentapeptide phosphotransferase/UDP-N-acetylglucosamine-1-phosphate transferase
MKSKTVFAFFLITVGVIALIYQGISWTTREKAVDLGPIQISAEKSHSIPLPPIVGGVALGLGILLFVNSRKTA